MCKLEFANYPQAAKNARNCPNQLEFPKTPENVVQIGGQWLKGILIQGVSGKKCLDSDVFCLCNSISQSVFLKHNIMPDPSGNKNNSRILF